MRSYLHINGFIHRDVKAANLLIDDDGTVLLGDLGVAASLTDDVDTSSRSYNDTSNRVIDFDPVFAAKSSCTAFSCARPGMGKRKSFVGTVRATSNIRSLAVLTFINAALLDGARAYSGPSL